MNNEVSNSDIIKKIGSIIYKDKLIEIIEKYRREKEEF